MNEMDLNTARRLVRDMLSEGNALEGDDAGYLAVSIDDVNKMIKLLGPTTNCILECDSPSIPPEPQEYLQCGCADCVKKWSEHEADRRRPRRGR